MMMIMKTMMSFGNLQISYPTKGRNYTRDVDNILHSMRRRTNNNLYMLYDDSDDQSHSNSRISLSGIFVQTSESSLPSLCDVVVTSQQVRSLHLLCSFLTRSNLRDLCGCSHIIQLLL